MQVSISNEEDLLLFIRKQRLSKGYSQASMAYHLNISQNYYCKIENGKLMMKIDTLCRLMQLLEIEFNVLKESF